MIERVAPQPADAASPCVNICVIDDATRWCRGCGRTLDEIAGWGTADVTARRMIRARLPERMAVLAKGGEPSSRHSRESGYAAAFTPAPNEEVESPPSQ